MTFYRGGRFITVPVIDRGPFRRGVAWDLTAAAAQQLGMASTTPPALDPLVRRAADIQRARRAPYRG